MRKTLCSFLLFSSIHSFADAIVDVEHAFAVAVPPGQKNSAAFMTLKNNSAQPLVLVAADSSASKVSELHTHSEVDGVMMMRKINQIEIPAKGKAELKSGGLHIMLIGLKKELPAGSTVDLSLKFSDGSEQNLVVPVESVSMKHGH